MQQPGWTGDLIMRGFEGERDIFFFWFLIFCCSSVRRMFWVLGMYYLFAVDLAVN